MTTAPDTTNTNAADALNQNEIIIVRYMYAFIGNRLDQSPSFITLKQQRCLLCTVGF